jgi:hypothetical protein
VAIPNQAPGALAGVLAEFDRCWPWLDAANLLAGGRHSYSSLWAAITTGNVQFWPFERCAALTYVDRFPDCNVLRLWLVGGELANVLEHEAEVAEWAKSIGCVAVELVGRKGWEKALRNRGYSHGALTLTRKL